MASQDTPLTPQPARPAAPFSIQRSFTVPSKLETSKRTSNIGASSSQPQIETLYAHPSAKIVAFSTSNLPRTATGSTNPDAGGIPWSSITERIIAIAPCSIYRVPGSVAFLSAKDQLVQTLFPRTQCWCVDDRSIFVLRKGPTNYHRIEFPCESEIEKSLIEDFKQVLGRILQYEKTTCPFRKSSGDDLPDPETPTRRKGMKSQGRAKKWRLDRVWRPEDGEPPDDLDEDDLSASGSESVASEDHNSNVEESVEISPSPSRPRPLSVAQRAQTFQGHRSVTAPLPMAPAPSPLSKFDLAASNGDNGSPRIADVFQPLSNTLPHPQPPPSPPVSDHDPLDDEPGVHASPLSTLPRSNSAQQTHTRNLSTLSSTTVVAEPAVQYNEDTQLKTTLPESREPLPGTTSAPHEDAPHEDTENSHQIDLASSTLQSDPPNDVPATSELAVENVSKEAPTPSPVSVEAAPVSEALRLAGEEHITQASADAGLHEPSPDPQAIEIPNTQASTHDEPSREINRAEEAVEAHISGSQSSPPPPQDAVTLPESASESQSLSKTVSPSQVSNPSSPALPQRQPKSPVPSIHSLAFSSTRHGAGRQAVVLTIALVQKAMEILTSPPGHLVELMLRIARRVGRVVDDKARAYNREHEEDEEYDDDEDGVSRHMAGAWETSEDEGPENSDDEDAVSPAARASGRAPARGRANARHPVTREDSSVD